MEEGGSPKDASSADRISNLPDDCLRTILSLLPIGAAVRTRILSRRWRDLHESPQDINFHIDEPLPNEDLLRVDGAGRLLYKSIRRRVNKFFRDIDQFLHRLPDHQTIQSLRIHICCTEPYLLDHITPWIGLAIKKQVRELDIDLSCAEVDPVYTFPAHLLLTEGRKAPTLKQLSLRSCLLLPESGLAGFSSLKSLTLEDVGLTHDFLSHCHNLEELSLRNCGGISKLEISLPLKHLKVFCPRLEIEVVCAESLVSFECSKSSHAVLKNNASSLPIPTNLNIGMLHQMPGCGHVGEGFNLLSAITLHRMAIWTETIGDILANCPNLEQFGLQECSLWFTYDAYTLDLAGLVRLKHLEVTHCCGIKRIRVCSSGLTTLVFLAQLSITRNSLLDDPGIEFCSAAGRVPPLKHLHLRRAQFPVDLQNFGLITTIILEEVHLEEKNVKDILIDCSLLERLYLTKCNSFSLLGIIGPSLKLKYLRVSECVDLKDLKISAQCLTTFEYKGEAIGVSFIEAPELVRAEMNIAQGTDHQYMACILTALTGLPRLQTLLLYIEQAQIPSSLPLFKSLKHLDLCIGRQIDVPNFCWVEYLLMASPFLQKLKLEILRHGKGGSKQRPSIGGIHNYIKEVDISRPRGIKKEMVPRYLRNDTEEGPLIGGIHNRLEEIELWRFRGFKKEIEFAIRLMHNAKALKLMKIDRRRNFCSGWGKWDGEIPMEWVKSIRSKTRSQLAPKAPPGVKLVIR